MSGAMDWREIAKTIRDRHNRLYDRLKELGDSSWLAEYDRSIGRAVDGQPEPSGPIEKPKRKGGWPKGKPRGPRKVVK